MTDVNLGPAEVNLTGIVEHDAWSLAVTLSNGTTPYNLTGLTCTASILLGDGTHSAIAVAVTNAAAGQLTLSQATAPQIYTSPWALRVGTRTMLAGTISSRRDVLT